jgi:hypothetical protein
MERLVNKYGQAVRLDPLDDAPELAETTRFGIQFLPDRAGGAGPLYVVRVIKDCDY